MEFDYVLVGGGLQSSLIALAILKLQPSSSILIVEQETSLGGNHTWSFHDSDIPPEMEEIVDSLCVGRWSNHEVRFPGYRRRLSSGYATISSTRLAEVIQARSQANPRLMLRLNARVADVHSDRVVLSSQEILRGKNVIDARGPVSGDPRRGGFQKFLGLEMEFAQPTGPEWPILMDATVEQIDGYRFVYTLPLSPTRLLIEDTYYARSPDLNASELQRRVLQYAESQGWRGGTIVREEQGVLPIPWRSAPCHESEVLTAGYRGGWFHPTTGYSFPLACQLALTVAHSPSAGIDDAAEETLRRGYRKNRRYCHLLNWMLFCAYAPESRYKVLERFYRLPEATIQRFYSLSMTPADRARILCGRPPQGFSVRAALSRTEAL